MITYGWVFCELDAEFGVGASGELGSVHQKQLDDPSPLRWLHLLRGSHVQRGGSVSRLRVHHVSNESHRRGGTARR